MQTDFGKDLILLRLLTVLLALCLGVPQFATATPPLPSPVAAAASVVSEPAAPASITPPIADAPLAPTRQPRLTPDAAPVAPFAPSATDSQPVAIGDLWHRIRLGFKIADFDHPRVAYWEESYARQPDYLRRLAERGSKYLYHIVDEIEKRNMPTEVALLPIIESAFNPKALSHAKAAGLWQFIPSTGKSFGLSQTFWFDNRRDVVQGTRAALDYLQMLHGMFNSWELAFAAYNCGEGCVGRAIERNQKKGLPTDFASLNLPNETRDYVPKLMAVKNLISSPANFGVELTPVHNEPYFARIAAPQMDVKLAAHFAQLSVEEFQALNPAFNRPVALSDHGHILLPQGKVDTFQLNLARHQHPLVNWTQYGAKKGESVAGIAQRFGISVKELRAHNGYRERKGKLLYATTLLVPRRGAAAIPVGLPPAANTPAVVVPVAGAAAAPSPPVQSKSVTRPITYRVKSGDTLSSIADRRRVSVADLQKWNRIKGTRLAVGQSLVVGQRREMVATHIAPEPVAASPATSDSGLMLAVNTPRSISAPPPVRPVSNNNAAPTRPQRPAKPATYTVRNGDNVSVIAQRTGVSVADILRLNRLTPRSTLQPGMKLRVKS
jgi:membrane-bound lytic murein transglycosylase D